MIRDELTGWLAGLERQGREQERAFFLECWNGDAAFTIDRIGRGSVHVPHACISLFGGIQPARLRDYLADAMRDGPSNDGLMQRFQLMVWPDIPPAWRYVDRQPDTNALECAAQVYRRMAALDAGNPLRLQFDDEAQTLFEQWLTDLEQRIRGEEVAPAMQAHLAKYRSLMPSLALLFALADGQTDSVPISHARLACDWCEYLETHANRVYSSQARPEHHAAIALSRRLAKGWKREEGFFTVRDVYRNGWAALDSPDAARGALLVLEEYGWVRRETDTQTPGRPSETYFSIREWGVTMLASRRWRDWNPPGNFRESPEHELTKPTKPISVSFVSPTQGHSQEFTASTAPRMPEPLPDPDEWREAFLRWLASECIAHWRLHGNLGGLHVAFSEWEVGQGEVPCSRTVFERLLVEQGWEIHPTLALVSGLSLRKYVDGSGYFPERLSRQSR